MLTRSENIKETYQLTPKDRAMLVMPLFHVHGLLAGLLAPLYTGGSIVVPPKFSAATFWPDFATHKANWYTAVPTIHQILLKNPPPSPRPDIRFIPHRLPPARGGIRCARARGLRYDRGRAPDDVQPAPAR